MSNVVAIVRYSGEIKYWFIATNKLTNVTCSKCLVFSVFHNHQPTPFLIIIAQNACNNNYIFVLHSIVNIITRETMRILSEKKNQLSSKGACLLFYAYEMPIFPTICRCQWKCNAFQSTNYSKCQKSEILVAKHWEMRSQWNTNNSYDALYPTRLKAQWQSKNI